MNWNSLLSVCRAPNAQLINEGATIASVYKGKSVAEQNSVDLAWSLLMDDNFTDLRNAIYKTDDERTRFRQLVVNGASIFSLMSATARVRLLLFS